MAASKPTVKNVSFTTEDVYRKKKMVVILENRDMLSEDAKNYILKGRR